MAQDISGSIDRSFIVDGNAIDAADVTTPLNNLITVINAMLNGGRAFDRLLFEASETLTISGGVLAAPSKMLVNITSETGSADDLDTIGASNNRIAIFRATSGHTITMKSLTGNLHTGGADGTLTVVSVYIGICQGGFWTLIPSRSAPFDATYITQTANGGLTGEQSLSSLATGHVKVTTLTGVLSSLKEFSSGSARPSAGEDTADGYAIGSIGYDTTQKEAYICVDPTNNNAIWRPIGLGYRDEFRLRAANDTVVGIGVANPTVANSETATLDADGPWVTMPSTASAGNLGGLVTTTFNLLRGNKDPFVEIVVKIPSSPDPITNVRYWIGLIDEEVTDADTLTGSATSFAGFRFSTVAGDTGWRPVTCDGTTQNTGTAIGTVVAGGVYRLQIIGNAGGFTQFRVNDGPISSSGGANYPAATTNLGFVARVIPQAASIRNLLFGRARFSMEE